MKRSFLNALILTAIVGVTAGCSSSSDDNKTKEVAGGDQESYKDVSIDATSGTTYFNLETGKVATLTDEAAATSTDWHLGFKRNNIIVNGGFGRAGSVQAAVAVAQDDFYNDDGTVNASVFLNASAEQELDHLTAEVNVAALAQSRAYKQDVKTSAVKKPGTNTDGVYDFGWFNYDSSIHKASANPDNYYLLKSAGGNSYAKFNVTELDTSEGLKLKVEFDVQPVDTASFNDTATFNALVTGSGTQCFDFDTDAVVECSTSDWDIQLEVAGRTWNLWTNSGVSGAGKGGAYGPMSKESANDYQGIASDTRILRYIAADKSAGLFDDNKWYAYNLADQHKLYPNYRVYIIDADKNDAASKQYVMQVIGYYNEQGTSGNPTIRFAPANIKQ